MDEHLHSKSSASPSSTERQEGVDTANNRNEEALLRSILQTLLFLIAIQTRQLAYQQLQKVLPQEGKEVPSELDALHESIISLRKSVEVLDGDDASIGEINRTLELVVRLQNMIEKEIEAEITDKPLGPILKFFSILAEPDDPWGIIRRCDELFSRYSHLSHLALPFFWREAIVELHKYNSGDTILAQRAVELPAIELETVIGKLLREAPCSGLLQVLKRRFESSLEMSRGVLVLPEDQKEIKEAVRKYIEDVEKIQEGIISAEDLRRKVQHDIKNFSFGGGDMETRIPKVAYDVASNLLQSATALPPRDERLAYTLNVVSLVVALNQIVVESSNLSILLKELKV
ncbi:MAG: hypothetical protein ACFFB3_17220 [Candidatus Hodarchaeota archaeon]